MENDIQEMNRKRMKCLIKACLVVLTTALFVGCSSDDVPEGILTEQQMVPILIDVYLAEGKVNELRLKRDSAITIFEVYEHKILETYSVNDSTYTNSLRYYFEHPLKMESIYETVLDSLTLMEKRLEETKEEDEVPNKDSTNIESKQELGE